MKNQKPQPFLGALFQRLAPKIGAEVVMEPEWNIVGQIRFKNGKKRYFRNTSMDLNTLGASEIAVDKDYASFFMNSLGYNTIPGKSFYSNNWSKVVGAKGRDVHAGFKFASKLGFPVMIKPNSKSQGYGVRLVHNKKEFYAGMKEIFKKDKIAIVQEFAKGNDYRIVVLQNKVISAYRRIPLNIVGDGKATIKMLLRKKQKDFILNNRDTKIKINDPRILLKLKRKNLSFNSILPKDKRIFLLDNANLSTGGNSIDVTNEIHPSLKRLAINLTKDMGLRFCGVDIMIEGEISKRLKKYSIIEINAAPGLDHYVTTGNKQKKIVEKLYLEVLKNMGK